MKLSPVLVLIFMCELVYGYKILGIFPHPGSSHFAVFRPLLINLAKKGHELTIISHFPLESPPKTYTDISIRGSTPLFKAIFTFEKFTNYSKDFELIKQWRNGQLLLNVGYNNCKAMMDNESVKKLEPNQFDILLVEDFNSDCAMGLVYKLNAPFIGLTTNTPMPWTPDNLGLISNPAFIPTHFLGNGVRPDLFQCIESFFSTLYFRWYYYFFSQIPEHKLLTQYFGDDLPPLENIMRNMSMLLLNTYFPLVGARPYPPSVVEVGGIYHGEVKELPKDIKDFMDDAKDGVILFSMGSMLIGTSFPKDKLQAFQLAFSELKQKVIWKWEDDVMPDAPKNVKLVKWIPQYDILHHKNIIGFVTHAGMLGISEAARAGVPVLAIPIFGDQFNNAASVRDIGAGVYMDYHNITKDSIRWALKEVIGQRMQKNAKVLSELWNDRPMSAMDTAIYWIEYIARHGGKHLHPSSVDLPFYRYFMLDAFAVIISFFVVLFFIMYKILKCLLKLCRKKSKRD